ncbi:DNA repair protein RAD23, putative [Plasmodium gallinaceum]|uniref:UV excision repair protein RAD23 n=1 Tax=Plasmodium gallinaceum TaxID=5849 RepID=A0A1J1GNW6_PLAGA|nr:DNA repair protein RAD23, putative [Plasmodium gallinaceum]CRG94175.1 DNA repair protein RAD23, putative [Plasmodium gallinaceum]
MIIKVRTLQNNEEEINVDKDDTIFDLKKKVENVLPDMPSDKQKLIFSGKILKDESKAVDILNENDIIIVMVTRKIFNKNNSKDDVNNTSSNSLKNNDNKLNDSKVNTDNKALNINDNINALNKNEQKIEENENNNIESKQIENVDNAESMLLIGEKLKETIDNICAMGFEKENVEKAMILAYNNPNRAIDYLTNGFPASNDTNENAYEREDVGNIPNLSNLLINDNLLGENQRQSSSQNPELFRNSPFFNVLRDVALSNPQRIPEILEMIGRTDPSFLEYIREHQGEFLRAIQNYNNENVENEQPNEASIEQNNQNIIDQSNESYNIPITPLNENEMESIKKLESLGFPKHIALEAFIACDKNEEMAANYLFENMNDYFSE